MPTRRPLEILLAFALGAVLAAGTPCRADIVTVGNLAIVEAVSGTDSTFDRPDKVREDGFSSFDQTLTAATAGGRAAGSARANVAQALESASVTASGGTDVQHCCKADDLQTVAIASNEVGFVICVDERSTYTASLQGNVQASGDASTHVIVTFDLGDEHVALEAEDSNLPRSVSLSRSGVFCEGPGAACCVNAGAIGSSILGSGQPTSRTSWSLSLSVVSSPTGEDGDVFRWTGPSPGSFADAANWDPEGSAAAGVPTFVDGTRRDAAVVSTASPVTIDLAAGAGLARTPVPRGVERRIGRLVVDRTQSLRPIGGTLLLDNLDLDIQGMARSLDGRSLEVGRGATLNLDQGIVQARHVAIGSDGDGTLSVQGPDGAFSTLGRFGLGADGDGNVDITGGATVTSAETVLGEVDGQGSARISGQGSLWQTGNLAVGLADDAALAIEGGARVESGEVSVDFDLAGDERAGVVVRGEDASATPSTWAVNGSLDVGGRGKVELREGGRLEAGLVRVGVDGSEADCFLGRACLDVEDGTLTADLIELGHDAAAGKLRIGPGGRVSPGLGLLVGTYFESDGEVTVVGPSAEEQLSGGGILLGDSIDDDDDGLGARGTLVLQNGAKVTATFNVAIGEVGESLSGVLELQGDASDPDATRFRKTGGDAGGISVGAESPEPAGEPVAPSGEILLSHGLIELVDADLDIHRRGRLSGLGRVDGIGVSFVSNAGVIGCGVEIDAVYTQSEQGTLECPQSALPGASPLSPLAASRFARAVRARPAPPPPAPPAGPFVVTGDATLGGTLVLQFLNGFAPAQGDAFPVLDLRGTVTGDFSSVVVRGLAPGSFDFERTSQDGAVRFTSLTDAVALPVVSLTGKTRLKEQKKGGLKLKVVRAGDTSAPMLVAYALGGSAENGVDYESLPGTVEIPAGKKSAKILLKPRRDGLVEGPETIELELLPGADYTPSLSAKVAIALESAERSRD